MAKKGKGESRDTPRDVRHRRMDGSGNGGGGGSGARPGAGDGWRAGTGQEVVSLVLEHLRVAHVDT